MTESRISGGTAARRVFRSRIACGILLCSASLAHAQSKLLEPDPGCNAAQYTEVEQFQAEVCVSQFGCSLTFGAATAGCKTRDFLNRIGSFLSPGRELTNEQVLDALLSVVPDTPGTSRVYSQVRGIATPATLQTAVTYDDRTKVVAYFEGTLRNGEPEGAGTQLTSTGLGSRGTWRFGRLNGPGIATNVGGTIAAGNFRDNTLHGEGFTFSTDHVLLEGKYVNGKPDGMMNVVHADGSSQRRLYKIGALLAEGKRVAKGVTPPDARIRTPEVIAEEEAEELAAFNAQLQEANSGALYALADENLVNGNYEKGRIALRELMSRYSEDPLAARAADRLATIPANAQAPPRAAANANAAASRAPVPPRVSAVINQLNSKYPISVPSPVLPESFYLKYQGRDMAVADLQKMADSDPLLRKITAIVNSGSDTDLRMKNAIASLEGLIVIYRQTRMFARAPERLDGWVRQRAQLVQACQKATPDPPYCLELLAE